ncbi:MAG: SAM-dependent methyltransferase, partial [Vulcanimicrobiota bacterium]
MGFEIESIGIIHTPFKRQKDIPIQPEAAAGSKGRVEVYPQFIDGLKDLEHFGRIWLIYYFHQFPMVKMTVTPSMDSEPRGVFATRASCRPSRIGMSNVRLLGIEQNILSVEE